MSSRRRLRGRRSPPGPVDSSAAVRGRNWEALPSGRCGGCRWWRCPGSSRCRGLGVVCLVAGGGGAGLLGVSSRLPVRRLPPPMFSTGRSVVMVVSCCLVGWCGSVAGRSLTGATVGRRRMRARAPEHQSQPAQPGSDEDSVGDPQRRRGEELRQERHEPEREQDPAGPGAAPAISRSLRPPSPRPPPPVEVFAQALVFEAYRRVRVDPALLDPVRPSHRGGRTRPGALGAPGLDSLKLQ